MQLLEEILCQVDVIKEGKLLPMAKKAFESPETGIQIIVPAAKNVIQDCASITVKYLPFFVFGSLANPFTYYKGKVNLECIQDFYARSKTNFTTYQLLLIILTKAKEVYKLTDNSVFFDKSDPYGDDPTLENLQSQHNEIFILSKAFGII
jgi:hypothetical protein